MTARNKEDISVQLIHEIQLLVIINIITNTVLIIINSITFCIQSLILAQIRVELKCPHITTKKRKY